MAKKQETWETLKSGVRKNGNCYASCYPTGWYFVWAVPVEHAKETKDAYSRTTTITDSIGPFTTFEEGEKEWKKKH